MPALLVFVVGVGLTLAAFTSARRQQIAVYEANFRALAGEEATALGGGVTASLAAVDTLQAFYQAGPYLMTRRFAGLAAPMIEQHAGTWALAWAPHVADADRAEFEAGSQQLFPDFEFRRLGDDGDMVRSEAKPDYYPIAVVEPAVGREAILGFDLASSPPHADVLSAARANAAPASTGRLRALGEASLSEFWVAAPVYHRDQPRTPEHFRGYVVGVYRADDLIDGVLSGWKDRALDIRVEGVAKDQTATLVYASSGASSKPELAHEVDIPVADRVWRARFSPPADALGPDTSASWSLLAIGIICTLLASSWTATSRVQQEFVRAQVRRRTRQLAAAKERAERKTTELNTANEELRYFAYAASHDLQEPVRSLVTFSTLLRKDLGDALPPQASEDLDYITSAAKRMHSLVNDLLALSQAGRSNFRSTEFPLQDCVAESLAALRDQLQEAGASISCRTLPTITGDRKLLTQVFRSLLDNAIKFRQEGRTPKITVSSELEEDGWTIEVADNGIGVAPGYEEKIFAPFQRLNDRSKYDGSGVGLAVCKRAVERHGGRIWLQSTAAEGASFRFQLPLGNRPGLRGVTPVTDP